MSSPETVGGWTGERFAHEAFVFGDHQQLRARVLPFVEEGLTNGDPVIVVAGERVRALLTEELGSRLGELAQLAAAEDFWQGGHQTLATYSDTMQPLLDAGRPWRLVGEPVWLGRPGGAEWSRFEAVTNEAFAQFPYYSLCLHDEQQLSADLVAAQLRAHPLTWDGRSPVASAAYEPTDSLLARLEPRWTPAPPGATSLHVTDLEQLLHSLDAWLDTSRVPSRADEVRMAVYELATNALRAGGEARVEQWNDDRLVLWQVRDRGPGTVDVTAGYVPSPVDPDCGRGLWIARSLADDSALRARAAEGTTVRLVFRADAAN